MAAGAGCPAGARHDTKGKRQRKLCSYTWSLALEEATRTLEKLNCSQIGELVLAVVSLKTYT